MKCRGPCASTRRPRGPSSKASKAEEWTPCSGCAKHSAISDDDSRCTGGSKTGASPPGSGARLCARRLWSSHFANLSSRRESPALMDQTIPIIQIRSCLLVSIQTELHDRLALDLQESL